MVWANKHFLPCDKKMFVCIYLFIKTPQLLKSDYESYLKNIIKAETT